MSYDLEAMHKDEIDLLKHQLLDTKNELKKLQEKFNLNEYDQAVTRAVKAEIRVKQLEEIIAESGMKAGEMLGLFPHKSVRDTLIEHGLDPKDYDGTNKYQKNCIEEIKREICCSCSTQLHTDDTGNPCDGCGHGPFGKAWNDGDMG